MVRLSQSSWICLEPEPLETRVFCSRNAVFHKAFSPLWHTRGHIPTGSVSHYSVWASWRCQGLNVVKKSPWTKKSTIYKDQLTLLFVENSCSFLEHNQKQWLGKAKSEIVNTLCQATNKHLMRTESTGKGNGW